MKEAENKVPETKLYEPKRISPFDGPFGVWCFRNETKGSDLSNRHAAKNKFRNVICIDSVRGNEDLIYSATWVFTDDPEIERFAATYNKQIFN